MHKKIHGTIGKPIQRKGGEFANGKIEPLASAFNDELLETLRQTAKNKGAPALFKIAQQGPLLVRHIARLTKPGEDPETRLNAAFALFHAKNAGIDVAPAKKTLESILPKEYDGKTGFAVEKILSALFELKKDKV